MLLASRRLNGRLFLPYKQNRRKSSISRCSDVLEEMVKSKALLDVDRICATITNKELAHQSHNTDACQAYPSKSHRNKQFAAYTHGKDASAPCLDFLRKLTGLLMKIQHEVTLPVVVRVQKTRCVRLNIRYSRPLFLPSNLTEEFIETVNHHPLYSNLLVLEKLSEHRLRNMSSQ